MTSAEPRDVDRRDIGAARSTRNIESRDRPTFERHYRISERAEMWSLGRETVRLLVKDEPGVIRIRLGRKKAHTIYSEPESVAERIHTRLLNSR
jgi:hypothetical protein